jgi:hypothetical protein
MVLMALSVLSGYLMIAYLSQVDSVWTLVLAYLGLRARARVLGLLNVVLVQTLCFLMPWVPFLTELAAALD